MAMLSRSLEQQHIVRLVADGRDLRSRQGKAGGQISDHRALIRILVGDVEIVGLRPVRRRAVTE
jgi:hypothetical protein